MGWPGLAALLGLALLSLAIARGLAGFLAVEGDGAVTLVAASVPAVALMLAGPVPCLAAMAALGVMPLAASGGGAGSVSLTPADAFFAALVCWWFLRLGGMTQSHERETRAPIPIHAGPIVALVVFSGFTLVHVAIVDASALQVSWVSWARVVETVLIGFLAAQFVRDRRDVTLILAAVAVAALVAVVWSLVQGVENSGGGLGDRNAGVLNPNTLGLVSGLLFLLAVFPALSRSFLLRVPLAVVACLGLVQARSVGSLLGTCVALALGLALTFGTTRGVGSVRAVTVALMLVAGLAGAFVATALIRPDNLPTSKDFSTGSGGHREVLAVAGLEVAARNPVIGVGWRRSQQSEIIGARDIDIALRKRFKDTPNHFFPSVVAASVHNAYVQVLADLGLVGFGLFAFALLSVGRDVRSLLARVEWRTREWHQLWYLSLGLVLILVWLNDNPIFGGQVETITLAMFLGVIAGLGRSLVPVRAP
jgi:O-antigen ligase